MVFLITWTSVKRTVTLRYLSLAANWNPARFSKSTARPLQPQQRRQFSGGGKIYKRSRKGVIYPLFSNERVFLAEPVYFALTTHLVQRRHVVVRISKNTTFCSENSSITEEGEAQNLLGNFHNPATETNRMYIISN